MRAALILSMLTLLSCVASWRACRAEGTEHFVFLGNSVGKTMEFSYYLDVCGDQANGERLRRLALRKLDSCEIPSARKQAIRSDAAILSVQMESRIKSCDADADCALGKRQYCPGIAKERAEFLSLMDEAESSQPALDRLAGGCN
jgi:hypothetical protein